MEKKKQLVLNYSFINNFINKTNGLKNKNAFFKCLLYLKS